jgi:hypothetical protein
MLEEMPARDHRRKDRCFADIDQVILQHNRVFEPVEELIVGHADLA